MELAFFPSPSPMEIMVIAVIALIVLGPSKLPEAARSLGKGLKEMRDSFQGGNDREREGYERLDHDLDDDDLDDGGFDDAEVGSLEDGEDDAEVGSLEDGEDEHEPDRHAPAGRGASASGE